jgi:hypothetical protein
MTDKGRPTPLDVILSSPEIAKHVQKLALREYQDKYGSDTGAAYYNVKLIQRLMEEGVEELDELSDRSVGLFTEIFLNALTNPRVGVVNRQGAARLLGKLIQESSDNPLELK